jgi:phenylacetic acid degradation operon negative regulatory protein
LNVAVFRLAYVQPKTEELLNFLLWSADKFMRPTFRNLTDSYESWAYRNGLLFQVAKLEKQQLLEHDPRFPDDRLYRLTEHGRLHALGGRDPQAQWTRHWDGRWRLVLFDVPVDENPRRDKLRRYLRSRAFGCLQGSVWITPDPVQDEYGILAGGRIKVQSLLLLEARPAAGESDAEIVAGAWDFPQINRRYERHLKMLDGCPVADLGDAGAAEALRRWAADEREAWLSAVQSDPLLPERLLSAEYLGRRAWEKRKIVLRRTGERLRTFAHH